MRRRRDLIATIVILAIAILLTAISLVAILTPGSVIALRNVEEKKVLQKNEARVYGPVVRIASKEPNAGCQRRRVPSCAKPEHDGGFMVAGSGTAELKATMPAYADWRVVEDIRNRICVEFTVDGPACESANFLEGSAVAIERY